LTSLNLKLLDTDDPNARGRILDSIYSTEQQLGADFQEIDQPPKPVPLTIFQHDLRASELFVEYVLGEPHSYALAVTANSVHRYTLPPKSELEKEAAQYRSEIKQKKTDLPLAQQLYDGLLGGIPEVGKEHDLIVVPDGNLHLLPFSALANSGQYVLTTHLVTVAPSGTVFDILSHRANRTIQD